MFWKKKIRIRSPQSEEAPFQAANVDRVEIPPDRAERTRDDSKWESYMNEVLVEHQIWILHQGVKGVRADFSGQDLSNRLLMIVNLQRALFRGANLQGSILFRNNFRDADLTDANLRNCQLTCASLDYATVDGADFTGATFGLTSLGGIDFSKAKGLCDVKHCMPSSLAVDTLIKSKGSIPQQFLIGCGLSDTFVCYLPSLLRADSAITYCSCFISHSTHDAGFCETLYNRLRREGVRVWYSPASIRGGDYLADQIDQAISVVDKVIVVLSTQSMKSKWTLREIKRAREREIKEGRRILFPVRIVGFKEIQAWEAINADTGEDLAEEIRKYYIPDFAHSDAEDRVDREFQRLVRDLRG